MSNLENERILLRPLSIIDAKAFFALYSGLDTHETAEIFTRRIIGSCEYIWTVRLQAEPQKIIGDCALHHYQPDEESVEIGGSLLAEYQRKSIMKQAMGLVIDFAIRTMHLQQITGRTKAKNIAAINLVKQLGFSVVSDDGIDVVLAKKV